MTTRILIVIGHPFAGSLQHSLAAAYAASATEYGADVDVIDLAVDPLPAFPRSRDEVRAPRTADDHQPAPEIADYARRVREADHIALFYPQWWGTYPAVLKHFFDMTLLSGDAYAYGSRSDNWVRGLKGRTARIVHTSDSPTWFSRLVYRNASIASVKTATLWYCGIKTVKVHHFGETRFSTADARAGWLRAMTSAGRADAARTPSAEKTDATARELAAA